MNIKYVLTSLLLGLAVSLFGQLTIPAPKGRQSQLDPFKFERNAYIAWKRKDYQFAIDNFNALRTFTLALSPEKDEVIRKNISKVEEEYRLSLKFQRSLSRRMEHSNDLVWHALKAHENQEYGLALQLAHYACKVSNNTNITALKLRSDLLRKAFVPTISSTENKKRLSFEYSVQPMDTSKALIILTETGGSKNEETPDSILLDIPPIISTSIISEDKKVIVLCRDSNAYWVNLIEGTVKPLKHNERSIITSVSLWNTSSFYLIGFKNGKFTLFDRTGKEIIEHTAATSIDACELMQVESNKKGQRFLIIGKYGGQVRSWEVKSKKGRAEIGNSKLLIEDAAFISFQKDRKSIAIFNKKQGLQYFNAKGDKAGYMKFPLDGRDDEYQINAFYFSPIEDNLVIELQKSSYIDSTEIKIKIFVDKDGRPVKKQPQYKNISKTDIRFVVNEAVKENRFELLQARQIRYSSNFRRLAYIKNAGDSVFIRSTERGGSNLFGFASVKDNPIEQIALDSSGINIIAASKNRVYIAALSSTIPSVTSEEQKPIRAIAIAPKGDFAVYNVDKTLYKRNMPGGGLSATQTFEASITALDVHPSGDTIIVGLENGNVLYIDGQLEQIITAGLGRIVGRVEKVQFSRKGKKSLILAKDNSQGNMVLDIINNTIGDISADRRYFYVGSDNYPLNNAVFSNDEESVLLNSRKGTILISTRFLKPEYEIHKIDNPFKGDEIKESLLLEGDQFIANISYGGDINIQTNPIAYLDREMKDLDILEQIKYKVADPDSLVKNAETLEEIDKSIDYLKEYYMNEDDQRMHVRGLLIELTTRRVNEFPVYGKDSLVLANHYFSLSKLFHEQSYDFFMEMNPEQALAKEKNALKCLKAAWRDFKNRPDVEQNQAKEALGNVYQRLSLLNTMVGSTDLAYAYADTSDQYKQYMRTCRDINTTTRIILSVWQNDVSNAIKIYDAYKNAQCSDVEGNQSIKDIIVSNLEYLSLIGNPTKQQKNAINQFQQRIKNSK